MRTSSIFSKGVRISSTSYLWVCMAAALLTCCALLPSFSTQRSTAPILAPVVHEQEDVFATMEAMARSLAEANVTATAPAPILPPPPPPPPQNETDLPAPPAPETAPSTTTFTPVDPDSIPSPPPPSPPPSPPAPIPPPVDDQDDSTDNTGRNVGIAVGAVVLALVSISILTAYLRRRGKNQGPVTSEIDSQFNQLAASTGVVRPAVPQAGSQRSFRSHLSGRFLPGATGDTPIV